MMGPFVGLLREAVFSPGRVDDDAAILLAVADELRRAGRKVEVVRADEATWPGIDGNTVVFTMAQGDAALSRLADLERGGVRVVNSVRGVLNCQRHRTVPLLTAAGISFPRSLLVDTHHVPPLPEWAERGGAWVKRGDVHATEADDVVRVEDAAGIRAAVDRFAARGVGRAVVQENVPGAVVKFYGVEGGFFFPVVSAGAPSLPAEVLDGMADLGARAARVLDVEVYGGDCVVGPGGALTLIDLNDWPSYARCRSSASAAIAAHVGRSGPEGNL